jgi:hypothetical protein
MKIEKSASGKNKIKISKSEWTNLGKKAGWMKEAQLPGQNPNTQTNPMNDPQIKNLYDKVVSGQKSARALRQYCEQKGIDWKSDPYLLEVLQR